MFGLGLLYVVLAAVLIALGFSTIFVLVIAGGGLWAQWYFSDTIALRSMRAVEVSPEQAPAAARARRPAVRRWPT